MLFEISQQKITNLQQDQQKMDRLKKYISILFIIKLGIVVQF